MKLAKIASLALVLVPLTLATAQEPPPAAPPAVRLSDLVPAEATFFYGAIPSFDAARTAVAGSDLGKAWGELKPFFDDILRRVEPKILDAKAKFEHDAGVSFDDALAFVGGGGEVAALWRDRPGGSGDLIALVRTAGREAAARAVLDGLRARAQKRTGLVGTYELAGARVTVFGPEDRPELLVAELRGALVASSSRPLLDRVLAATTAAPAETSLGAAEDFAAVRARTVPDDAASLAFAYANAAPLIAETVRKSEADARALYHTGLRDLRALGAALTAAKGTVELNAFAWAPVTGERRNLLGIFAEGALDIAAVADDAPADSLGALGLHLDLGRVYDRFLALADQTDPDGAGRFRGEIARLDEKLHLSVRRDLLGAIGPDWTLASFVPEGGGIPSAVIGATARDEAKLRAALARVADLCSFETREITLSGRRLTYVVGPEEGHPVAQKLRRNDAAMGGAIAAILTAGAYAIEGGRIYFADLPQTLDDYLARRGPKPTPREPQAGMVLLAQVMPGEAFPPLWNAALRFLRGVETAWRGNGAPIDTALLPRGRQLARHFPGPSTIQVGVRGSEGVWVYVDRAWIPALAVAVALAAAGAS